MLAGVDVDAYFCRIPEHNHLGMGTRSSLFVAFEVATENAGTKHKRPATLGSPPTIPTPVRPPRFFSSCEGGLAAPRWG